MRGAPLAVGSVTAKCWQKHVVPAKAGTHADVAIQVQYGFPPAREVILGSAGNDEQLLRDCL
jgi:hypothetical protein